MGRVAASPGIRKGIWFPRESKKKVIMGKSIKRDITQLIQAFYSLSKPYQCPHPSTTPTYPKCNKLPRFPLYASNFTDPWHSPLLQADLKYC